MERVRIVEVAPRDEVQGILVPVFGAAKQQGVRMSWTGAMR